VSDRTDRKAQEKASQEERVTPLTYAASGVDIDAKTALLARLRPIFKSTFSSDVVGDIGAFGGMFSVAQLGYKDPVLVASTDSVGTKVKVAALANQHWGIGYDIVAHCANDIACQGARPLFFLDCILMGKLDPIAMEQAAQGLAEACKKANCPLIGGETAELPGLLVGTDYDIVGFIMGVIERDQIITGDRIQPSDALIALASDGLHTNGYSMARKLFFELQGMTVDTFVPELNTTIGAALLQPHRLYSPALLDLIARFDVRGIAHITGGGLPDNLPRCLPTGCRARIDTSAWTVPPLFQLIQRLGAVPDAEMFHVFNMGIGAVVVVPTSEADAVTKRLIELGETAFPIGQIVEGEKGVELV
jgi:phosphoribosylformylglycinamidine cyclo-ligase